ncbi:MAG: DASS family sodium-coupled anion symporter [Ignavibacteriales bacterium]|nr:DASS family sodium-coupled anion symporter [Ignavibacteriales bacterium]
MNTKSVGFILGILSFIIILILPTLDIFLTTGQRLIAEQQIFLDPQLLARSMQSVLAVLTLMIIWWITEPIPIPATALLPAVLFPILKITGLHGDNLYEFNFLRTLLNYANPVIYLFLGGFLLAGAMQKWKLDRRLTLYILTRGNLADNTKSILLGIMITTAFISMWISNTATAAMMLPLGLGVLSFIGVKPGESRFGTSLMLGIAWSASIGGVGTVIGTPPNGIALAILNSTFANDPGYRQISFLDWMKFGIPYVILAIPVAWFVLIKIFPAEIDKLAGGKEQLRKEQSLLGKLSSGEKRTIAVVLLAVFLWISNPFWKYIFPVWLQTQLLWLDEYLIGLFCGVLLFLIPVKLKEGQFLLEWHDTKFVDWGTLILFGGGIALSDAMFKTGLATWIATSFIGIFGTPSTLLLMIIIIFLIDFLTEVTSNTAVTSMMVPIVISIALTTGENPVALSIAVAVASSMGFMLPVATPPNALVYGTGYVKLKDMIKAGFVLDILGWIITIFVLVVISQLLFGVF